MSRFYKALDSDGKITSLNFTPVESSAFGEQISKTEFCMTKCGIKIFIGNEAAEKIRQEDWWR